MEQVGKLGREMGQVHTLYTDAEQNYGLDLFNLLVGKSYMTKLLFNEADNSFILRHETYMLAKFNLVVSTVSIEEAVQLQAGQAETAAAQN